MSVSIEIEGFPEGVGAYISLKLWENNRAFN